jgi:hypothetical protein
MRQLIASAFVGVVLGLIGGTAAAYPQFQLARDQTCTGCHISPAGGNLLNENGLSQSEAMSQFGTAPEFFYNKLGTPDWLVLGGDLRGAAGFFQTPEKSIAAFPMQIEVYASVLFGNFSLHVNAGPRPSQVGGNKLATSFWSREHYLMWKQNKDDNYGLYARVGRFMPVMGLRLAEHPVYTRRFGGTQLYADTYGAAVEYVDAQFEAHATGFIEDPVIDPVSHSSGAAAYAELRLGEHAAVGAESMYEHTADDQTFRVGATAKVYIPGPDLLFQAEGQFVNQLVNKTPTNPFGGAPKGLVGYVLASHMLGTAFLVDVGYGFYDSNFRIKNLDRDCFDLNLHWFTTSHLEIMLNARLELIGYDGDGHAGGPAGAYALIQGHYRL